MFKTKYSKNDIENAIKLYNDGVICSKIISQNGMSEGYFHYILRKHGVKKQKYKGNWNKKYFVNENFFEKIDSPEKAYWLGWMYSDGNVHPGNKKARNTISLGLQIRDKYIVQNFVNCLESNHKILSSHKGSQNRIFISNKKLMKDLIKHGCLPKKSLILRWPTTVPDKLIPYFLRGIFEGDGTVSALRIRKSDNSKDVSCRFAGSHFFCKSLNEYLLSKNITNSLQKQGNISVVYIGGMKSTIKIFNLLYSGDLTNMILYRKYKKFLDIVSYVQSKYYQI